MLWHSWFNSIGAVSWGVIWFCVTGWGAPLHNNCWDHRMMVIIIFDYSASAPPPWVSHRDFVLRCEKYHSFPEPPSPPWISGMWHSTRALSGDNRAPVRMWHIPVGAVVFIRSRILSLWDGLVGIMLTTQSTQSRPQTPSILLHFSLKASTASLWKLTFPYIVNFCLYTT